MKGGAVGAQLMGEIGAQNRLFPAPLPSLSPYKDRCFLSLRRYKFKCNFHDSISRGRPKGVRIPPAGNWISYNLSRQSRCPGSDPPVAVSAAPYIARYASSRQGIVLTDR